MPKTKKSTQLTKAQKAKNDFYFIVVVSVFAIVTIFAANMMATAQQQAAARQQRALPVAQMDLVPVTKLKEAKQSPKPVMKQYLATPTPIPNRTR